MYLFIRVSAMFLLSMPFLESTFADQENLSSMQILGAAVSEQTLSDNRGGYTQIINTNNLNAELYNNQANNNITGTNIVNGGSFANSSGFATIIQNSGNNVIIQNATILNLKLQ